MNKKYLLAVVASTLMFAACGDDVTEIHQDGMAVLEAGEKLSKQACDTTNVGEMLFVMDSSAAFVCDGKSWQTLKGADGKDGVDGKDGADGVDGKDGADGKDGVDGKDGEKGEKGDKGAKGDKGSKGDSGDEGTSCTAEPVTNAAGLEGLEVTCGETVVDTIWNGKNGEKGDPGTNGDNGNDGVGCSLEDDGEGAVSVTCGEGEGATTTTIFKAMCGMKPYDPAKSFCSEGELYSCDDKPYDPAKWFCSEGELYSCNDKPYDPKKQYCKLGTTVEDYGWLTDSRDKHVYKTVKICNDEASCQTWMAENLNYSVNPGTQSWCGGGEAGTKNEGDCSVYGRLYTWAAAVGKSEDECGYGHECDLSGAKNEKGEVRGVCPEGWHLPSNDEWNVLFTAVGGASYAGQKLKADSDLWNEGTSNDDSFGFAVLPAGYRDDSGSFNLEGNFAYFWSSREDGSPNAIIWLFLYYNDYVHYDWFHKYYGLSVRCLRD